MKNKTIARLWLSLLTLCAPLLNASAQGTAFTYQGKLSDHFQPANSAYNLTFTLYGTNTSGTAVAGPLTNNSVAVSNGLFSTTLDFGSTAISGNNVWLELGVQTNGGSGFTVLSPRQQIAVTPYTLLAASASNVSGTVYAGQLIGTIPASQFSGIIAVSQMPSSVVTNNATNATLSGTFNGNGFGLTNLNTAALNGALSVAQLPPGVLTNGESGVTLSGAFVGDGSGLASVILTNINGNGVLLWVTNLDLLLASSPAVGTNPQTIVAADVNGDGKIDLISANYSANTLTVLTNTGNGTFVLSSSPAVGNGPYSVTAADVNGDGKIDLITANVNTSTLTILTNNGSGGFVISASPAVGGGCRSVLAVDVNNDGKIDLISANTGVNSVTILTNNGTGTFTISSSPSVGSAPFCVVASDINGDGKMDLITANVSSGNLTVLTNNGTGGFVLSSSPVVGASPESVTVADVNGDGKKDLIAANIAGNTVSILTNNGTGTFTTSSTLFSGYAPYCVAAADLDSNGKIDLITANGDGTLGILTNNGTGTFGLSASVLVGGTPVSVVAADVNADGKIDLIAAKYYANALAVLLNFQTPYESFTGIGSNLTNLNASNITIGTLSTARLPFQVLLTGASGVTLNGSFSSIGTGLTSLKYASFTSGTFGGDASGATNVNASSLGNSAIITNSSGSIFTQNVGIGTTSPFTLLVVGNAYCNGSSWVSASDRNLKRDFEPVDPQTVLKKISALPVTQWQYKTETNGVKHVGPTAQDFHAAFGLNGDDDKHISTIDENGVALAGVQGVHQKLQRLKHENESLKNQLDELQQAMELLVEKK